MHIACGCEKAGAREVVLSLLKARGEPDLVDSVPRTPLRHLFWMNGTRFPFRNHLFRMEKKTKPGLCSIKRQAPALRWA